MTDTGPQPSGQRQTDRWLEPGKTNLQLIYILYLAGFLVPVVPLIGIVMAYLNRGKSEVWLETHYTWVIRTFWIAILYSLVCMLLAIVLIGFLLMFVVAIWVIVRCIIGLQALGRNEPIQNPQSWIL